MTCLWKPSTGVRLAGYLAGASPVLGYSMPVPSSPSRCRAALRLGTCPEGGCPVGCWSKQDASGVSLMSTCASVSIQTLAPQFSGQSGEYTTRLGPWIATDEA